MSISCRDCGWTLWRTESLGDQCERSSEHQRMASLPSLPRLDVYGTAADTGDRVGSLQLPRVLFAGDNIGIHAYGDDVERCNGTLESFQRELPHRLRIDCVLD